MPLRMLRLRYLGVCALLLPAAAAVHTQQKRSIPVGLDAYRQWDQWPAQRIGMRTYMRSTYDRKGGNEGADASHFLYQLSDTFNVALDLEGPGMLVFTRYNHWHGSPWLYVIDGKTHVIGETATANPLVRPSEAAFIPAAPFPPPLNQTWSTTSGADLIRSPIAFEHSFQMAYSRTRYGTGYYIFDCFVPGTPLVHPLNSWDEKTIPGSDVIDLINKAGTDIAPKKGTQEQGGSVNVPANGPVTVVDLKGKSSIRALAFTLPKSEATAFEHARLRIVWDGRQQPSVDVPIALFHGAGTLFNLENREYLVKAFPVSIRFVKDRIVLACYFPMPYFTSAHIELVGAGTAVAGVMWNVRTVPLKEAANTVSYFHATYRDFPTPTPGHDLVLLDTRGQESENEWSGSFVGTSVIFSHNGDLKTLEGDPRFFFDDSLTPQAQGTGTEEWGGGGDYFSEGKQSTMAFAGHPVGERKDHKPVNDEDNIQSMYRFLLEDLFPFGKNAVIDLEHGGIDDSTEHYETIAYWYGLPSPSLIQTDMLQIGDAAAEKAHGYLSPEASTPYRISSRYEWGVDHLDGKDSNAEVYPELQDTGRITKGTSEFDLKLRSDNLGVLLRRKLDYQYPDQRAEVSIQTVPNGAWKPAGIWYLAGSNIVVYSNPKEELGTAEHRIEISNRRFRDDEFLIPMNLTNGRDKIRVRVKFTALNRPLFPGNPVADQAWSEIKYTAFCFIEPDFKP